jgi:acyl-CoA hydrolase
MTKQEIYQSKLGTLDGALNLIKSNDCIAASIYANEPTNFISNLHTIAERVENVTLWTMNMMDDYPVMTDNSLKGKIDIISFFYNSDCRNGHSTGRFTLVPTNLHSVGYSTIDAKRPNVYVCCVPPMDEDGNVHISFDLQASLEWLECADTVIFEINPQIPKVFGETAVPIEMADYIYEVNNRSMPYAPPTPTSPVEKKIAEYVSSLINDGDCIQLGIGGIPGAVGEALLDKKDLGIHTEMITASMGRLIRAGAVTNSCKIINKGKTIGAFAWGDQELYDLMDHNEMFEMRRCSYTNDPFIIMQNDNMVSVNTAIQLDLTGQICSESIGTLQFSGTGGATDFAYGAYHSKGGKGIIALTSTAKDGTISKIQPHLTPGSIVSISRNIVDYVVTEYGIAKLKNRSIRDRVNNLIAVAHPDFRAELRKQANELMLW